MRARFVPADPAADEVPDDQVQPLNARDPQGCAHVEITAALDGPPGLAVRVFFDRSVTIAGEPALDRWEYENLHSEVGYALRAFESATATPSGPVFRAEVFHRIWAPPEQRG